MRAKDACTSSRQYGHALRGLGRERIQRNTQANGLSAFYSRRRNRAQREGSSVSLPAASPIVYIFHFSK